MSNNQFPTKIYTVNYTNDNPLSYIDMFCIVPKNTTMTLKGIMYNGVVISDLTMQNLVAFSIID